MFHPSGHWTKCHLAFLDIPDPSDLFILPGSLIYSTHTLLEDLLRSMHPAQHWGGKNISREKAGGSTKDCCGPTSGQLPGRGLSSGQVGSAPAGRRNRCWCSRQGEVGWGGRPCSPAPEGARSSSLRQPVITPWLGPLWKPQQMDPCVLIPSGTRLGARNRTPGCQGFSDPRSPELVRPVAAFFPLCRGHVCPCAVCLGSPGLLL